MIETLIGLIIAVFIGWVIAQIIIGFYDDGMVICHLLCRSNTILHMDSMESNERVMGTFLIIACTLYLIWILWPEGKK